MILLHQVVLFRQFSNQRWSIVWITSGRQIVVRIAARILATGFTVAVHRSEGRLSEVQQEFPLSPKDRVQTPSGLSEQVPYHFFSDPGSKKDQ